MVSNGTVDFVMTNLASVTGLTSRQLILNGFFFDYSTKPVATFGQLPVTASLAGTSTVFQTNGNSAGSITTDTNVNGSYVFKDVRNVAGTQFSFGVNGSAWANVQGQPPTYGSPTYNFPDPTLGNNGDDYGLIGSSSTGVNGGKIKVIRSGITLRVTGLTGLTNVNQISDVDFAYASGAIYSTGATNGTYLSTDGILQPVPTTSAGVSITIGCLVGILGTGAGKVQSRRCKQLANKA